VKDSGYQVCTDPSSPPSPRVLLPSVSPTMVACPSQTPCALAAAAARVPALRCVPIPHTLSPCVSVGRCCSWPARWLGLSRASPSPVSGRVPLVASACAGKSTAELLGAAASNPARPAAPSPPLSPCTASRPLPACCCSALLSPRAQQLGHCRRAAASSRAHPPPMSHRARPAGPWWRTGEPGPFPGVDSPGRRSHGQSPPSRCFFYGC
jgi:hypothetical protein